MRFSPKGPTSCNTVHSNLSLVIILKQINFFFKTRGFKVSYLKFREWSLARKFFSSFGTTQILCIFQLPVYSHFALLKNFPEQFEIYFHSKYLKKYEVL